jgi:hypothetical protein
MSGVASVNVVCDFGGLLALQKAVVATRFDYVFSDKPVRADYHVVVGQLGPQSIPPGSRAQLFVVLEPPEIHRYDLSVIRLYTATIGPGFRYLRNLPRHSVALGLFPWRVGYDAESNALPREFALPDPVESDARPVVSALISGKTATSKQRRRRAAAAYFSKHLPAFRLAGRDTQLVRDKADFHRLGKFHLAVENSRHLNYNTEKLFDAILMKNLVFYDGDLRFLEFFDRRAFHPLDVNRKRASLRKILRVTRARRPVEEEDEALETNRNLVLTRYNFFSNIELAVLQLPMKNRSTKITVYPAHFGGRPSARRRLKSLRTFLRRLIAAANIPKARRA